MQVYVDHAHWPVDAVCGLEGACMRDVNFRLKGVCDRAGNCVVKKHVFKRWLERPAMESVRCRISAQVGLSSERSMLQPLTSSKIIMRVADGVAQVNKPCSLWQYRGLFVGAVHVTRASGLSGTRNNWEHFLVFVFTNTLFLLFSFPSTFSSYQKWLTTIICL